MYLIQTTSVGPELVEGLPFSLVIEDEKAGLQQAQPERNSVNSPPNA